VNGLRIEVQQSVAVAMRAAEFRKERLALIRANEGPVELPSTGKVVVHLAPADCHESTHHDVFHAARYLAPLGRGSTSQELNFDGIIACERGGGQVTAYAQGFWNGRVEMVDSLILSNRGDGRRIPTLALESSLIRVVEFSRRYYDELGIAAPFSLGLALLGVQGYQLAVDELIWSEMSNHPIERADLIFPEISIPDRSVPGEDVCRPLFDLLWNACGFDRCLDYDANDRWSPRSSTTTGALDRQWALPPGTPGRLVPDLQAPGV
jgi:hypothetical protein